MRAARYLGVPPWDLIERPKHWQYWARMADQAERDADLEQRAQHKLPPPGTPFYS